MKILLIENEPVKGVFTISKQFLNEVIAQKQIGNKKILDFH